MSSELKLFANNSAKLKNFFGYFLIKILNDYIFYSRWSCHFDDDNYVNVKRLYEVLSEFDHLDPWYIGKISIPNKIQIRYKNVRTCKNIYDLIKNDVCFSK